MSDTTASFTVDVEETGADGAASSLEALKAKILGGTAALSQMRAAMRNLKGGGAETADAMNDLKAKIDDQKSAIAGAQQSFIQLGGTFDGTASSAKDAGNAIKDAGASGGQAGDGMTALLGPLGKIGGHMAGIGRQGQAVVKAIGSMGMAGAAVLAAAVLVVLVAGLAIATEKILAFGIATADAARTQGLLAAGIAGSVAGGAKLDTAIAALAAKVPLTREELMGLAGDLEKSGLKGDALTAALDKAAIKAATLKFGPDFAKQMLSLDQQSKTFGANIAGIFGGLKIEGLLSGLAKLVDMFSANSASGKALHAVFLSLFQPIVDGLTRAIPYIQIAFLTMVVWVLKARNALRPYAGEIKLLAEIFGGILVAAILLVGVSIFIAFLPLIVLIGAVVLVVYILVKAVGLIGDAFDAVSGAASAVFGYIATPFKQAYAFLSGIVGSFASIGSDIISGIVDAIMGGASKVIASVTALGKGALNALKSIFDSHSPSKAFGRIADTAPQGMTKSMNEGAGDVADASEDMGKAALAGGQKGMSGGVGAPGGSSGGKSGGNTYNFHITGVKDAEQIKEPSFLAKLAEAVEQAVQMSGAEPA